MKLKKFLRLTFDRYSCIFGKFLFRAEVRRLFKGKTVAIVGSSPEIIGRGLGEIIEYHDVVVRINSLNGADNPADLGERNDVVFLGGTRDEKTTSFLFAHLQPQCSVVMCKAGSKHALLPVKRIADLTVYPKNWPMYVARRISREINSPLFDRLEVKPPRSGVVCAATVVIFGEPKHVEIFGMSRDSVKAWETTNGIRFTGRVAFAKYQEQKLLKAHCDPSVEIEMLKELVNQNPCVSWRY